MERILVLDDDDSIRESMLLYFADLELEAVGASSTTEARAILSSGPCDIAIVDLRLPGDSGEDFIEEANRLYPELRFVIHTGSANYQLPRRLAGVGIRPQDVHAKPVADLAQLLESVRGLRNPTQH